MLNKMLLFLICLNCLIIFDVYAAMSNDFLADANNTIKKNKKIDGRYDLLIRKDSLPKRKVIKSNESLGYLVIQQEEKDTVAYYLIDKKDSTEKAYKLAYHLEDLTSDTEAVIFRRKQFETFPNELLVCKHLKILILEDVNFSETKSIKDIFSGIKQLNQLLVLVISRSNIKQFPSEIAELQSLEKLYLNFAEITTVPKEIGRLQNLTELVLAGNAIKDIPKGIQDLKKLKVLNLGYNQLSSLPKEIGNLKSLNILVLRNNKLNVLLKEIGKLKDLQALYLNANEFIALPKPIKQLKKLRRLNVEKNQLSILPKEIGRLESLETLNLSDNQLSILPREIGNLQSLEFLNLTNNQLIALPNEIGNLQELTKILLKNNQLSILPKEIGNLGKLNILELVNNKLSVLPREIGNLQSLEFLNLTNNQLIALPNEIGNLQKLTKLLLKNNQLSILPKEMQKMESLKYLDLYENEQLNINSFTEAFKRHKFEIKIGSEQYFNTKRHNSLLVVMSIKEDFLVSISDLKNLTELYLPKSNITNLPAEMAKLVNLRYLYLRYNKVNFIAKELRHLKKLKEINLSDNQMLDLPTTLTSFVHLKKLSLFNNYINEKNIENLRNILRNCKVYSNKKASDYGDKAWRFLSQKQYKEAEWAARKGLELDDKIRWIYGNLAHALLFQGQYEAAEKIYLELKDERFKNKNNTFKVYFLDDFRYLNKKEAIPENYRRDVEKIKKLLQE